MDLNRSAVWENTTGVRPSQPMHVGAYSRTEERERLQTSYNNFHNYKLTMHDRRKGKYAQKYRIYTHNYCLTVLFIILVN